MIVLRDVTLLGTSGLSNLAVEGAKISQVSPEIASLDALSIECHGALAFPGLINSHDHLEFDCYDRLDGGPYGDYLEWAQTIHSRHTPTVAMVEAIPLNLRIRFGLLKNLLGGVTSVAHHGHLPEHPKGVIELIQGTRDVHSPRLGNLRRMLMPGLRPIVAHIGEGINPDAEREIDTFLRWNLWRHRLVAVHAIAMRPEQAERFAAVIWCPLSNEFLFGRTAAISALKQHTVILFGTDSTITAPWNIWSHMRRAREIGGLTDGELFDALTANAAKIWNLGDTGRIKEGWRADIVVARKTVDDPNEAFFSIDPADILLVMKRGEIVLFDASLRSQLTDLDFFPIYINGSKKLTREDYGDLVAKLHSLLPSMPVPVTTIG